jgi:hypothetical protein
MSPQGFAIQARDLENRPLSQVEKIQVWAGPVTRSLDPQLKTLNTKPFLRSRSSSLG